MALEDNRQYERQNLSEQRTRGYRGREPKKSSNEVELGAAI